MKHRIAIAAFVAVAATAACLPATASAQVGVSIVIGNPPPLRHEIVPHARHGYVWAPGYWDWNGRRYVWIAGHWERVRPGQVYVRPEWHHERDGWRLDRGGWRGDRHDDRGDHRGPGHDRHDDRHDDRRGPDRH